MTVVTFPNITSSFALYDFRIKIEAQGGALEYTTAATVKYINCENDLPIQNNNEKVINVTFEVGDLYQFSKSVSAFFESMKECPILRYKIDRIVKVKVNETISEIEDYATIDNVGLLTLNYFSSAKPKMEIYVSASTSATKMNDTWSNAAVPLAF
jgi:aldehyde:ferredoxin oxidoreductase